MKSAPRPTIGPGAMETRLRTGAARSPGLPLCERASRRIRCRLRWRNTREKQTDPRLRRTDGRRPRRRDRRNPVLIIEHEVGTHVALVQHRAGLRIVGNGRDLESEELRDRALVRRAATLRRRYWRSRVLLLSGPTGTMATGLTADKLPDTFSTRRRSATPSESRFTASV
jgi:hypothetical protein